MDGGRRLGKNSNKSCSVFTSDRNKRRRQEEILKDGENKTETLTLPQYLSNRCEPILYQIKETVEPGMEADTMATLMPAPGGLKVPGSPV